MPAQWAQTHSKGYFKQDSPTEQSSVLSVSSVVLLLIKFVLMALLFEEESYAILGACFEVYKEKGTGFLEPVYQECLEIEFGLRGIPFVSQPGLILEYKGKQLSQVYEPDFVCFGKIILEIKTVSDLNNIFRAQVHNYLVATSMRLGLLVNFTSHPKLEYERIVR